jgi:DNA topoisomerase-1
LPRVGDLHSVKSSKIDSKVTLPPPRYTEGSLIKKLESLGIGRPSTYASILQNIIGKAYIQVGSPDGEKTKSKNALFPTSLGIAIIDALQSQQFIDYDFTSKMEDSLDEIANGKDTYARVVSELYKTVTEGLPSIKLDTSMIPKRFLELPCPKCEKTVRRVQKKDDKSFFFWVHADEGQGAVCEPYLLDVKEKPVTKESLEQPCPKCEKPVKRVQKKDDKSFFFWVHVDEGQGAVCEPYLLDVKEKPVTKESLEQPCPKCEKPVKRVQKKDKSGWFWVHVEESNAEGCERFLPDLKGKPTTNELLEQPCPFCKNPIKRLKSKEKKEFFWVHTSQPISGGCSMYLSDTKGKPTKQTTGVKS